MKTIVYPEGSLIGDWKAGERIAQGGRGLTGATPPATPATAAATTATRSARRKLVRHPRPSLLGFGKTRGTGPDMQRYVYGKIYNAKAYNLCSNMPRFGHSGTLTAEQIKDLVALLLDPASPVNKFIPTLLARYSVYLTDVLSLAR